MNYSLNEKKSGAFKINKKYENLKQFHRLDIQLDKDIQLDDYTAFDKMDWIFCNWLSENNDLMNLICQELITMN